MFIFQDDFIANANNTIFSLMAGASADIQFTSVLLNMRDKVNHTMSKLGLTLDQTIEGALPVFSDTLDDFDFSDSDSFAAYLCQQNPKRFRVRAEDISDFVPWMDIQIFVSVLQTAASLHHLEKVLLLAQLPENADRSLVQLNTLSIKDIVEDGFTMASMSMTFLSGRKSNGNDCTINKAGFQKTVIADLTSIPECRIRKYDKTSFDLYAALNELYLELVANYLSLGNDTKAVELMVCEQGNYNAAYSHMNDNTVIGSITLPADTFKMLPFANYDDEGGARQSILAEVQPPEGVSMDAVIEGIYYTMTSQCSCEHDCCGCANEHFDARLINGNYVKLTRSVVPNY